MDIPVKMTTEGGRPLEELRKLMEVRQQYMHETSEQATTAAMLDVLVSLRAVTKTASAKKSEITIESTPLQLSFFRVGFYRKICLRNGKARYSTKPDERLVFACDPDTKKCRVWRWRDFKKQKNGTRYVFLIVAPSASVAQNWAYRLIQKRAKKHRSLAHNALSLLMKNTGSKSAPNVEGNNTAIIQGVIKVLRQRNGAQYNLHAEDLLDYAKSALKGGESDVNVAMQKACNKIAATINYKCKDLLTFKKLDTPFPEVAKRR